jgi:quinoprotein glucose dehydrogenase
LELAWTYRAGDARSDGRSQIQCSPIVIDGVIYCTSPQLKLLALDAANGKEIWRFDPFACDPAGHALSVNRGVVYWGKGAEPASFLPPDIFCMAGNSL